VTNTRPTRTEVIDTLVSIVRETATPQVLDEIASGDSQGVAGDDKKHRTALRDLFELYDCRLTRQPNNHWYPSEPIELIAFAVDQHSKTAQLVCNALLMIAELDNCDVDQMNHRWFGSPGEDWYRALAPLFRDPLLAGFEILHSEMSELERTFWDGQTAMQRLRDAGGKSDG